MIVAVGLILLPRVIVGTTEIQVVLLVETRLSWISGIDWVKRKEVKWKLKNCCHQMIRSKYPGNISVQTTLRAIFSSLDTTLQVEKNLEKPFNFILLDIYPSLQTNDSKWLDSSCDSTLTHPEEYLDDSDSTLTRRACESTNVINHCFSLNIIFHGLPTSFTTELTLLCAILSKSLTAFHSSGCLRPVSLSGVKRNFWPLSENVWPSHGFSVTHQVEISDLLLHVGCFASQSKGINFGD